MLENGNKDIICMFFTAFSKPPITYYLNHTPSHTYQDCQDKTVSQVTAKKNYRITNICFRLSGFIAITETAREIIYLWFENEVSYL